MNQTPDVVHRRIGGLLVLLWCAAAAGQQPIDLFQDAPRLGPGFVRIGAWNLRHINVEGGAAEFLPGSTREEDFAILVATFAKAIGDLGLDLVAVVEHQPRQGEANRLQQIRDRLNGGAAGAWRSDETVIDYDTGGGAFGGLQLGLLWNSTTITINPAADALLDELRQPRGPDGVLLERTMRAPWLVPVRAGQLDFDLMVLHLKSGGGAPQAEEVAAVAGFVRNRQSAATPRHLIVCGDWNIRPDTPQGRSRLAALRVPGASGAALMRVLTVEEITPSLSAWEAIDAAAFAPPPGLLPYSHFNAAPINDTFLDHIAISTTLAEVFDNPIQVTLASGVVDLVPGVAIAYPLVPEASYAPLTDHLPVVLTLRTQGGATPEPPALPVLSIVGAMPNPPGADEPDERVLLRNNGNQSVTLTGWRIGDSSGDHFWPLDAADGNVNPGQTVTVLRRNRNMSLNNTGGDSVVLINPAGDTVDRETYGEAASGQIFTFPP